MNTKAGSLITRRHFVGLAAAASAAPCCFAAVIDSKGYQLGCYTRPWDQFDYRTALDGIAEAGFKFAGIMTAKGRTWVMITPKSEPEEVQQIANEARQRGLKILSIYGGDFDLKSVESGIADLRRLVDFCAICSCPNLLLGGTSDAKAFERYYKVAAECCDYAASKTVGVSIKPHGGQNATGPECRKIIQTVGKKNFTLWYDPGNIFYYSDGKLDPVEDSATVSGLVSGMSIKDFTPPKEVLVNPGSGKVDFPRVMKNLRAGGFTAGPALIECLAKSDTAAGVTKSAREARKYFEELFATL